MRARAVTIWGELPSIGPWPSTHRYDVKQMLRTVTILVPYPMAMGTDKSSATGKRKEDRLSADAGIRSEAPTDMRIRRSPAPVPPPGKKGPTWRIEGNLRF